MTTEFYECRERVATANDTHHVQGTVLEIVDARSKPSKVVAIVRDLCAEELAKLNGGAPKVPRALGAALALALNTMKPSVADTLIAGIRAAVPAPTPFRPAELVDAEDERFAQSR